MVQPTSLETRFWAKADKRSADECWLWNGSRRQSGYGIVIRRENGRRREVRATHVAWSLHHQQPFPSGLFACHSCDNPRCVNPHHIWPGSHAENMADMVAKGHTTRRSGTCRKGHAYDRLDTRGRNHCPVCRGAATARSNAKRPSRAKAQVSA